jgi:ketosteroid isomerase-like protein
MNETLPLSHLSGLLGAMVCIAGVLSFIAEGDLAVVEWHGHATSIAERPYDNDYCWVIRVAEDRIVEVTAYLDGTLVEELFRTTER